MFSTEYRPQELDKKKLCSVKMSNGQTHLRQVSKSCQNNFTINKARYTCTKFSRVYNIVCRMAPKKRDKESDTSKNPRIDHIQADHELFLQAFESM